MTGVRLLLPLKSCSSRRWRASGPVLLKWRPTRARAARSCAWRRGPQHERRQAVPRREAPRGGQRGTRSDKPRNMREHGTQGGAFMTRLNLVLLLALLTSSLYLVSVQYESRRLFSDLDKERSQARQIETDKERLQVEKRAQATPLRVERLAREQLQMRPATPAVTHYVSYNANAAASTLGRVQ